MKPVKIPIEDVLDLHTFKPQEVPDLLEDYFAACIDEGIYSVRIIHGKGRGILRIVLEGFYRKIRWWHHLVMHLLKPVVGEQRLLNLDINDEADVSMEKS